MTVRTRTQLNGDADAALPDNAGGEISPQDVRQRVKDMADSAYMAEDVASTAELRANAADKLLAVQQALASLDFVALTDATTIAFSMAAGINRKVTLGGNRTLGQITNAIPGMTFAIEVSQPATTATRTLSYHSSYVLPEDGITIKTGANVKTLLVGIVLAVSGTNATKTLISMAGAGWTS